MITNRDDLQGKMSEIDMRKMDQATLEQNVCDSILNHLSSLTDNEFIAHLEAYFPELIKEVTKK